NGAVRDMNQDEAEFDPHRRNVGIAFVVRLEMPDVDAQFIVALDRQRVARHGFDAARSLKRFDQQRLDHRRGRIGPGGVRVVVEAELIAPQRDATGIERVGRARLVDQNLEVEARSAGQVAERRQRVERGRRAVAAQKAAATRRRERQRGDDHPACHARHFGLYPWLWSPNRNLAGSRSSSSTTRLTLMTKALKLPISCSSCFSPRCEKSRMPGRASLMVVSTLPTSLSAWPISLSTWPTASLA